MIQINVELVWTSVSVLLYLSSRHPPLASTSSVKMPETTTSACVSFCIQSGCRCHYRDWCYDQKTKSTLIVVASPRNHRLLVVVIPVCVADVGKAFHRSDVVRGWFTSSHFGATCSRSISAALANGPCVSSGDYCQAETADINKRNQCYVCGDLVLEHRKVAPTLFYVH